MISGRPGGSGWSGWSQRFTESGHLALDAVVAFVDEELPPGPAHRAAAHVDRCLTCAAEVAAQRQARRRVRAAGDPCVSSSLFSALCSIPHAAPLPGAPAGLAVAPDGTLVVPAETGRTADTPDTPDTADAADAVDAVPGARRARRSRRRTLGLPVAVSSGVVVGAAALAAFAGPAVVAGPAPVAPGNSVPRVTPTAAAASLAARETARDATRHEGSTPVIGTPSAPHGPGAP